MRRSSAFLVLAGTCLAGSPALTAPKAPKEGECEVVRILPDGRELRSRGSAASTARSNGNSSHASGVAVSSSGASSHSSVSVSSSSSGRGGGHARAVTSYTDERGHLVTTVRDATGCKITIDERD